MAPRNHFIVISDTRKVVVPAVCMIGDRKTIVAIMPEARDGSPYTEIVIGNVSSSTSNIHEKAQNVVLSKTTDELIYPQTLLK